tara:strand:- start:1822 stop:1962 length:141 start_codon:yes stop_codon:yes gene_type:complete
MSIAAAIPTFGVENIGTSSVARRITNVVVIKVRTAKIIAHLAEGHY